VRATAPFAMPDISVPDFSASRRFLLASTGEGTLKAKLDVWKVWYARPKPHMDALVALYHMAAQRLPVEQRQMATGEANLRPQFVQFNRCRNVLVEDMSIVDSPFWVFVHAA